MSYRGEFENFNIDINPEWKRRVRACVYQKMMSGEVYTVSSSAPGGKDKWDPSDIKLKDCNDPKCPSSKVYIRYPETDSPLSGVKSKNVI